MASTRKQAKGKRIARAKQSLPKSTLLKVKVLSTLVKNLSPKSKSSVFNNARKSLSFKKQGRKTTDTSQLVSFLEQPSISHCVPGRKDTVYMGKVDGKSVFKRKHYLLYNIRELVALYNEEHQEVETTYYQMHSTIAKEQHLILELKTPNDDCRCETCENATLLLSAVKLNLTKLGKTELATALLEGPIELMNSSVCTVKDFKCISGQCAQCPGSNLTHDIGKPILNIQAISYYR